MEGGYIELPQLGIKLELRQGDALLMRAESLWYTVLEVTNGVYRTGLVYFTHASVASEDRPSQ